MWIGHRKEIRKLTFQALALRRSESSIYREMELRDWLVHGNVKNNKLVEWKAFVDTVRIKSADLKNNFFVSGFWGFPKATDCRWERTQTAKCCLEWFGRFKYLATGLDALL